MVARTKKAAAKKAAEAEENEAEGAEDGYDELLSGAYGSIPKEQALPEGPWLLKTTGYKYRPKTDKASANVTFFEQPVEPREGVDDDALSELPEGYDFSINSGTTRQSNTWSGSASTKTEVE